MACLPGSRCSGGQCLVGVTGVSITPETLSLTKGETKTITVNVQPPGAAIRTVTWSSSAPAVATVDQNGTVRGVEGGTALLTATTTDGGFTSTCQVTVVVPVTGVTITTDSITISAGFQHPLQATVTPANATNRTITWSSSLTTVASVNATTGLVTAHTPGQTEIRATSQDKGFSASCIVTVTAVTPTSIQITPPNMTLVKGQQFALEASIQPPAASNLPISWASSCTETVCVSDRGVVTAVGGGQAVINATIDDGGVSHSAQCQITVIVPVTGIQVEPKSFFLAPGEQQAISALISPPDATNANVNWTSVDTAIARVDAQGLVSAMSFGTTTITASTTADGGFSSDATVVVGIPVSGLEVSPAQLELELGEMSIISVAVNPDNATIQEVMWSTSDTNVVTLGPARPPTAPPGQPGGNIQTVEVNAVGPGAATIMATALNGGHTASATIQVAGEK